MHRVLTTDSRGKVLLYNALDASMLLLLDFSGSLLTAMWDAMDNHVFLLFDGSLLYIHVLRVTTLYGTGVLPAPSWSMILCMPFNHFYLPEAFHAPLVLS
jgi:hypothetical protein